MLPNLYIDAHGNAWSYGTQILTVDEDGRTIGNVTKYSNTTSKHQRHVGVYSADVRVKDVPRGVVNLVAYMQTLNKEL